MSNILLPAVCLLVLSSVSTQASETPRTSASASSHAYWLSEDLSRLAVWEVRPVAHDSASSTQQSETH